MEYSFYKKKVSSNFTVFKRSTVTMRAKLYTVFQEVLRLLYNVSPRVSWKDRVSRLSKFVQTLYMSGYIEKERYNTIREPKFIGRKWSVELKVVILSL